MKTNKTAKTNKTEKKIENLFNMASDNRGNDFENRVALSKAIDLINSNGLGCSDFGMVDCQSCKCSEIVKKICRFVHENGFLDNDLDNGSDNDLDNGSDNDLDGIFLLENKNAVSFTGSKTTLEIIETARKLYAISLSNKKQAYGAVTLLFMNGKTTKEIVNLLAGSGSDSEIKRLKGFCSKVSCVVGTFNGKGGKGKVFTACKAVMNGQAIPETCKSFATNIKGVFEFFDNESFKVWSKNESGRKNAIKSMKKELKEDLKTIKLTA